MVTVEEVAKEFENEFMQPQITDMVRWFEVETDIGTEWVNQDLIGKTLNPTRQELAPYIEDDTIHDFRVVDGYGIRLSASGYMDCTPWVVYSTKEEALQGIMDTYGNQ